MLLKSGDMVRIKGGGLYGGLIGRVVRDQTGEVVTVWTEHREVGACRDEVAKMRNPPDNWMPERSRLPYGRWICKDGTVCLHNRDYHVIWEKLPDGTVQEPVDPQAWREIVAEEWFYGDGCKPYPSSKNPAFDKGSRARCEAALAEFGLSPDAKPSDPERFYRLAARMV
jgi:hypothetical protein